MQVGEVVVLLILLGVAGAGLAFLANAARIVVRGWQSRSWPQVEGTVIRSEVRRVEHESRRLLSPTYLNTLAYRYTVNGAEHTGGRVKFGASAGGREAATRQRAERYAEGAAVRVSYQPGNPKLAALETGLDLRGAASNLVVGLAMLGFSGFYLWRFVTGLG